MKRINLFFRWLVRPYPDLGLWSFINKRHLFVSLDANLQRVISRAFGINVGLNWCGVLEATRFLRKLNPEDPTKYDYVLSRVAIMGYCAKDMARSLCCLCPIASICKSSKLPKLVKAKRAHLLFHIGTFSILGIYASYQQSSTMRSAPPMRRIRILTTLRILLSLSINVSRSNIGHHLRPYGKSLRPLPLRH